VGRIVHGFGATVVPRGAAGGKVHAMSDYRTTRLWRESLEPTSSHEGDEARARLRAAFHQLREAAGYLAGEIPRELPDFTVHDITHLDALWEMAELVAGPAIALTPPEAFILGGAFLIHDLGMGLAAYPGGLDELRQSPVWRDAVALRLMPILGRKPRPADLQRPPADIEREATREALRALHARQAASLPEKVSWKDRSGAEHHLIQDVQLRKTFGQLIGRIAYSHHWPVSMLRSEFSESLGAPAWCPGSWKIEPLKLACLLRLADAVHIDARRAPSFLRVLRRLDSASDAHWAFQERMSKPLLTDDRLEYTSSSDFPLEEASAWWLAYETLEMIDRELRQVDMLIADVGGRRFAARGVIGVDAPARLATRLRTAGWLPVDARIQVSNVPSLVENLGGEELYGKRPTVPLRELIQNAADAVRGRRLIDERDESWGEITVRAGHDEHGEWLEVEDNGLGMSEAVLTGPLLDFGTSYWRSELARREFPGLLARGFQPTGKYGIGFFSVFMWGKRVRVTTQRFDASRQDTRVLEFDGGASSHPIVRPATGAECLREGGTRIRVWFLPPRDIKSLLFLEDRYRASLRELCVSLCPVLDVDLHAQEPEVGKRIAVRSSDWVHIDGVELLKRTAVLGRRLPDAGMLEEHSQRLRVIRNADNEPVGRVCVAMGMTAGDDGSSLGLVTAGGFRASNSWFVAGVLTGMAVRATRDEAIPLLSEDEGARWASEQAGLLSVAPDRYNVYDLIRAAAFLRACKGDVASLPIGIGGAPWRLMNQQQILDWSRSLDRVRLVNSFGMEDMLNDDRYEPDVLLVRFGIPGQTSIGASSVSYWPWTAPPNPNGWDAWKLTMAGAATEIIAGAWGVPVAWIFSGRISATREGVVPTETIGQDKNGESVKGWVIAELRKPKVLNVRG
jgi:hypothetical protein